LLEEERPLANEEWSSTSGCISFVFLPQWWRNILMSLWADEMTGSGLKTGSYHSLGEHRQAMLGTADLSIGVFEYGCGRPLRGAAQAIEQIFLRNRFWNNLVEIERDIRRRTRLLLDSPEIQHQIAVATT
jgi:hypothetical protein